MRASERVEAILEARGSRKQWLAAKLGIKESAFSRYLAGNRPAPPDFYQRIADVLQVPESLLHADETSEPEPEPTAA